MRPGLSCIWCKKRGTYYWIGYFIDPFPNYPVSDLTRLPTTHDCDFICRFRDIPDMGRDCEMRMRQL